MARATSWPRLRATKRERLAQPRKRHLTLAASIFIASCRGTVTTDFTVDAPADVTLQQVVVPLVAVEFLRNDGNIEVFELDDARIDLLTFVGAVPVRLLTNERLREGTYTGVRLLFDEADTDGAYVIDGLGAQRVLTITNGEHAPFSYTVRDDRRSNEELTLTLDLRLSLSRNERNEYALQPALRSVRTEEAGDLQGLVSAPCIDDATAVGRAAVYVFEGADVVPDDRDGQGIEPYATAPVALDAAGIAYTVRFLPAGTYTIALACNGFEEDPLTDDDLDFRFTATVEIRAGEMTRRDIES